MCLCSHQIHDSKIKAWSVPEGRAVWSLEYVYPEPGLSSGISAMDVLPDGKHLLVGEENGRLSLVDADKARVRQVVGDVGARIWSVSCSRVSEYAAVGHWPTTDGKKAGGVSLWRTSTSEKIGQFGDGHSAGFCVALSSDGGCLAEAYVLWPPGNRGDEGGARLWNTTTGQLLAELPLNGEMATAIAFSPDDKHVATAQGIRSGEELKGGEICVWEVESASQVAKTSVEGYFHIRAMGFSPDGNLLCAGADDKVLLWNIGAPKAPAIIQCRDRGFCRAVFSPDGEYVVAGSGCGSVVLIDAVNSVVLRELEAKGQSADWLFDQPWSKVKAQLRGPKPPKPANPKLLPPVQLPEIP